ncbi:MAG: polysaccharide biosynthesis protein [Bacteroidaceae bacterium]|nr:polysaccharide biosynthesis protein [Bacteroidaceae bacterium]
MSTSGSQRIVRNTAYLYLSSLFTTLISLYTSRLVLQTLGEESYGVYVVVGGIVMALEFLNAAMGGATSRFIVFELGKKNRSQLQRTFSSAFWVHLLIACLVVLVAETAGLWFLNAKLNIPADRMEAAQWVFQFSILTSVVNITQVPYNALMVAHERMSITSMISSVNIVLRLGVVFLLLVSPIDQLIAYSALLAGVSILTTLFYRWYCIRHFEECRVYRGLHRDILRPMLSFSLWGLLGYFSRSLQQQSISFVLNIFFGVTLNAAAGMALAVGGAIYSISTNITQACRPQIIKHYAAGDIAALSQLYGKAIVALTLLYSLIAVPFVLETDYILHLWLSHPPAYTKVFVQALLAINYFALINEILKIGIQATGQIRWMNIMYVIAYGLCVATTVLMVWQRPESPLVPYAVLAVCELAIVVALCYNLKQMVSAISWSSMGKALLKVALWVSITSLVTLFVQYWLTSSFGRLVLVTATYFLLTLPAALYLLLDPETRHSFLIKLHIVK